VRPPRALLATGPLWVLALVFASTGVGVAGQAAPASSPSPLNPFFAGTSLFYADLRAGYNVILGSPEDAARLAAEGEKVAYFLVGPEKPLSPREVQALAQAYSRDGLRLLVADETGLANPLLEALGAPKVDGRVPGLGGGGGWELMIVLDCPWGTYYTGLASRVEDGEQLCRAHTGDPVVSRSGRALVSGDSSIFANYLYTGYNGLPATREAALQLARLAAGDAKVIVYDNAHYAYREAGLPPGAAARLLGALASAASDAAEGVLGPRGLAVLALATLPWAVILTVPSTPRGGPVDEVEEAAESLAESLEALEEDEA